MSEQATAKKPTILITSIKMESEPIEVNGPEVDPAWLFTDAVGNEHRWQKDSNDIWCLPTLEEHVTRVQAWNEFAEEYESNEITEYFAPETGERVSPGMRRVRRFIQGCIEATVEFESNAIPPDGSVRFDECVFPMQYSEVVKDLGSWTFFAKTWKKIGPEKWSGVGVCIGAPPRTKEVQR